MPWSGEHRSFLIENYFKYGGCKGAIIEFRKKFNISYHKPVPTRASILSWVKKFKAAGTALPEKPRGSARTVRTAENVEKIKQAIKQSPQRSARQHALALGLSRESVRKIVKLDLQEKLSTKKNK